MKNLIGDKGAKAVDAGKQAGPKLLESLIGHFPLKRSWVILEDLINSPVIYFFAGLIEGFVSFMSHEKVVLLPKDV